MIIFLSIIIAILLLIILYLTKLYRDEKWNNLDFEERLELLSKQKQEENKKGADYEIFN